MTQCATCGNEYDNAMTITKDGETYAFDSFECAIQKLAPHCTACGCRVIGHGTQVGDQVFCCAHCAGHAGSADIQDRV